MGGDAEGLDGRRVAVIGCGGAGRMHADALARAGVTVTAVIDPDERRRSELARPWPDAVVAAAPESVLDAFDLAVVAVPDRFHAPVSIDLLRADKDVLVEKPMAGTRADAEAMAAAATASGRLLAVGHVRRNLSVKAWTLDLLRSGQLGKVERIDAAQGGRDDWVAASEGYVAQAAGGVVANQGAHTIDVLTWWFGPLAVVSCTDDNRGGQEANATIELTAGPVAIHLELSRIRSLRNTIRIHTERGLLEVALDHYQPQQLVCVPDGIEVTPFDGRTPDLAGQFDLQVAALSAALDGRWPDTLATPATGIQVASVIEECGRIRTPDEPWWMASAATR